MITTILNNLDDIIKDEDRRTAITTITGYNPLHLASEDVKYEITKEMDTNDLLYRVLLELHCKNFMMIDDYLVKLNKYAEEYFTTLYEVSPKNGVFLTKKTLKEFISKENKLRHLILVILVNKTNI